MKNDMGLSQRIPHNYEFAGRWQINLKGWALVVLLAGAVLVFGLSFILGAIVRVLLRGPWEGTISISTGGFLFLPILLGVVVAIIVLHEAVHGVLFLVLGGKPRFGFKLAGRFFPVAYATSKAPILRNQYLLVCLGPFLMLTLVFMVTGILANTDVTVALALLAMATNAAGSLADLMTAWKIRRHGRKTLYEDTENGFNWYVPSRPDL